MSMITTRDLERLQAERTERGEIWRRPPDRNELSALEEIHAEFQVPQFCCLLPGDRIEMIVGDWLQLHVPARVSTRKLTLLRSPKHYRKGLVADGIRLQPDRPGLYTLQLTLCDRWSTLIYVACFPKEVEKRLQVDDPKQAYARRMRLRQIVRDPRVTPESIIDSLETDDDTFGMTGRIVGGGKPLPRGASIDGAKSTGFSVGDYYTQ